MMQIIDQCASGGLTTIGQNNKIGIYVYASDSHFASWLHEWTACPDCGLSDCAGRPDVDNGCLTAPRFISDIMASNPSDLGIRPGEQFDFCSVGYTSKSNGCCSGWNFRKYAIDIGKAALQFGTSILMNAGAYGWCEFGDGKLW